MKVKSSHAHSVSTKQLIKDTSRDTLNQSMKVKKISCPHCEYKSTEKGSLQRHIKSVHEGKKFPCPQCEYKATVKGDLQRHIKSVHEGQKVPKM